LLFTVSYQARWLVTVIRVSAEAGLRCRGRRSSLVMTGERDHKRTGRCLAESWPVGPPGRRAP
jgi:hypothetical protein